MSHERESTDEKSVNVHEEWLPEHNHSPVIFSDAQDPKDPLNWSYTKKNLILSAVNLSIFAGTCGCLANASGIAYQAITYGKPIVAISYTLSASLSGVAVGPFLWQPLALQYGKPFTLFWSAVIVLVSNIWAAASTGHKDYGSFIGSRVISGIATGASSTVGGRIIMDLYPLKHRGKAFATWNLSLILGSLVGPMLSGYIVFSAAWTIQYWYNVALDVLVVALCFFVVEETTYPREGGEKCKVVEGGWLKRRLIFIPGTLKVHPGLGAKQWVDAFTTPWIILASPHGLIACLALCVYFGFAAGLNNVLAVLLQTPEEYGGYGLNSKENSNFLWQQWVGVGIAYVYGVFFNDRLPLWICKRRGGVWKPEYRLYALALPCLIAFPIGYGVMGLGLAHHLDIRIIATAGAFAAAGSLAVLPPLMTYLSETFMKRTGEANVIGNFSRLVLAIAFPFFVLQWEAKVGLIWLFGSMAFINIAFFSLMILLAWKGEAIRNLAFTSVSQSEAGMLTGGFH